MRLREDADAAGRHVGDPARVDRVHEHLEGREEEGLSVIIDAIVTARMIFARVRNYVIYRIACTLQLVFFFFLGCLIFEPKRFFCIKSVSYTHMTLPTNREV